MEINLNCKNVNKQWLIYDDFAILRFDGRLSQWIASSGKGRQGVLHLRLA